MTRLTDRARYRGVPGWAIALAAVGALFILIPVAAMTLRIDPAGFWALITSASSLTALRLSVLTSAIATGVCILLGTPMALVLARFRFRGLGVLRALVLLPLVLPPVVGGLALLSTFGRNGMLGRWLEQAGVQIVFTPIAVVLAQTFVSLPFFVLSLEGALRVHGLDHERAAATLGASPQRTLFRVTLPMLGPAALSAAVLAFARSLGEFGATLTVAGSLEGTTRTLPLLVYLQRETDTDQAIALSVLLIAVAVAVMLIAHRRGGTAT